MIKVEYGGIVPVYINDGGNFPEDQMFYLISGSGTFIVKQTMIGPVVTAVKGIDGLVAMREGFLFNIPKIPRDMFDQIVSFFKDVYDKYKSEAIVLLYFDTKKQEYHLVVPKQQVSGASVRYEAAAIPGHRFIGTIHSHGSMGAFHSGVDDKDEEAHDGIHITIGSLNNASPSISSSVVFSGSRIKLDTDDIIEPFPAYPGFWLNQVDEFKVTRPELPIWQRYQQNNLPDVANHKEPDKQEKPNGKKKKKKKNEQQGEDLGPGEYLRDLMSRPLDIIDEDDLTCLAQYTPIFAEYAAEAMLKTEIMVNASELTLHDLFSRWRAGGMNQQRLQELEKQEVEEEFCNWSQI